MTKTKGIVRPLMPLVPPSGDIPFAIQYTLVNDLGPNDYEEFWFDSKFFVIKESDFETEDDFIKHRYQKGLIYGPLDQEIMFPAGTIVVGVSTTEQFRPGENNDGSPLSNQDTDADGVPDDLDTDPEDYQVPYPDADMDRIHVNEEDPNSDPDDNDPNIPYPDVDEDGYNSNIDPDDTDPFIIPETVPYVEPKIQAEYVILYPEPSIFEGVTTSSANQGQSATVKQSVRVAGSQELNITPGAYKSTSANVSLALEMRGKMRFAVGSAVSGMIPWDATESELATVLREMATFNGRTVEVLGTIPEIIDETEDYIRIDVYPPHPDRIMLWGVGAEDQANSVIPNTENGGVPTSPYKYGFKCRTNFANKDIEDVTFNCFNGSQYGTIPIGTKVMCRKINNVWHIIYP